MLRGLEGIRGANERTSDVIQRLVVQATGAPLKGLSLRITPTETMIEGVNGVATDTEVCLVDVNTLNAPVDSLVPPLKATRDLKLKKMSQNKRK